MLHSQTLFCPIKHSYSKTDYELPAKRAKTPEQQCKVIDQIISDFMEYQDLISACHFQADFFENRTVTPAIDLLRLGIDLVPFKKKRQLHLLFAAASFKANYTEFPEKNISTRDGKNFLLLSKTVRFSSSEWNTIQEITGRCFQSLRQDLVTTWNSGITVLNSTDRPLLKKFSPLLVFITVPNDETEGATYSASIAVGREDINRTLTAAQTTGLIKSIDSIKITFSTSDGSYPSDDDVYPRFFKYDTPEYTPSYCEGLLKEIFDVDIHIETNLDYFNYVQRQYPYVLKF